jgi:hypothetical protein
MASVIDSCMRTALPVDMSTGMAHRAAVTINSRQVSHFTDRCPTPDMRLETCSWSLSIGAMESTSDPRQASFMKLCCSRCQMLRRAAIRPRCAWQRDGLLLLLPDWTSLVMLADGKSAGRLVDISHWRRLVYGWKYVEVAVPVEPRITWQGQLLLH